MTWSDDKLWVLVAWKDYPMVTFYAALSTMSKDRNGQPRRCVAAKRSTLHPYQGMQGCDDDQNDSDFDPF